MHESKPQENQPTGPVIPSDQIAGPPLGIIGDHDVRKELSDELASEARKAMTEQETVNAIKRAHGITKAGQTSFVAARRLQGYSENRAKQNPPRPRRRRGKRREQRKARA